MIKDLDKLKELMNGLKKPESDVEIVFMAGYNHALSNGDFLDKYIEQTGSLDYYDSIQEWHAFMLGFGMGQKKLNEEIADFENDNPDRH